MPPTGPKGVAKSKATLKNKIKNKKTMKTTKTTKTAKSTKGSKAVKKTVGKKNGVVKGRPHTSKLLKISQIYPKANTKRLVNKYCSNRVPRLSSAALDRIRKILAKNVFDHVQLSLMFRPEDKLSVSFSANERLRQYNTSRIPFKPEIVL